MRVRLMQDLVYERSGFDVLDGSSTGVKGMCGEI